MLIDVFEMKIEVVVHVMRMVEKVKVVTVLRVLVKLVVVDVL